MPKASNLEDRFLPAKTSIRQTTQWKSGVTLGYDLAWPTKPKPVSPFSSGSVSIRVIRHKRQAPSFRRTRTIGRLIGETVEIREAWVLEQDLRLHVIFIHITLWCITILYVCKC